MTTFDRAALDALPIAPGSTGAIRERAFEQFQALPLPSHETEEWRYTDLSDFALDFVPHAPGHGRGAPAPAEAGLAASILQHNSSVVMTTSGQDLETKGVIFCDLDVAAEKYPDLVDAAPALAGADRPHEVHRAARRLPDRRHLPVRAGRRRSRDAAADA